MPNLLVESKLAFEARMPRVALDVEYMYKLLPEVYREVDSQQGLPLRLMFREVLGTRLNTIVANIEDFSLLVDYEYCPVYALDHLLYNIGNPFPTYQLSEINKRKLIAILISIYKAKGTFNGILLAIQAVTGLNLTITVPWLDNSWTLGYVDELGVTTHTGAVRNDRFNYTFIVHLPTFISLDLEGLVRLVVEYMKPLYTHYIIAPPAGAPPVLDHWELGISELGYETFLHTGVPTLFVTQVSITSYEAHGTMLVSRRFEDESIGIVHKDRSMPHESLLMRQQSKSPNYEHIGTISVTQVSIMQYEAHGTVFVSRRFNDESGGSGGSFLLF